MSASCCGGHEHGFDGMDPKYRRVLWIVIAINGVMFLVETLGGYAASSQALQADALDFLGDTLTYGVSLWAIGRPLSVRSRVAVLKGASLFLVGLWVLGKTIYEVFYLGLPRAEIMGTIGFLAMTANIASVLFLLPYKDGDANVRSVWLCSRNDAIGNVIVMGAALAVWGTATGWPDVIVAGIMAGLFLSSAWQILAQARRELTGQERSGGNDGVAAGVKVEHR